MCWAVAVVVLPSGDLNLSRVQEVRTTSITLRYYGSFTLIPQEVYNRFAHRLCDRYHNRSNAKDENPAVFDKPNTEEI